MLFKQIYNWLKYKTTTPSILFKNRLFVERDSKHKRIFNNIGLTFRNLKWNAYESENTQPIFKFHYFKTIFFVFSCLILFIFFNNFYNYYALSSFYNNIFFFFWTGLDIFDYYFTFLIWIFFLVGSLITNLFQSYFFFNNLNSESKKFKLKKFNSFPIYKEHVTANFSKKDYKFFLLNWINSEHLTQQSGLLTNLKVLFATSFNHDWWYKHYMFFFQLYRLTFFLNLNNRLSSSHVFHLKLSHLETNNFFNLLSYLDISNSLNKNSSLSLLYLLNNQKNYPYFEFNQKFSTSFLCNRTFWNPTRMLAINQNDSNLFKQTNGLFYFNSVSASELVSFFKKNKNLDLLDSLIRNQIISAKWNRWLYKYSILHRKVFKNSHKLTLSKKILNSGIYNNDLAKKNLWNSEFFNKSANFNLLHFATSLLQFRNEATSYSQNFNNSKFVYNLSHSHFSNLNAQESSFFWFLKRFYFFSNLGSNRVFSTLIFKKTIVFRETQNLNNFFNFQNFLLKSFTNNFKNLNLSNSYLSIIDSLEALPTLNKNSYLLFSDLDLLNKDDLEILNWISSPSSFIQYTEVYIPFFFLNNFSTVKNLKSGKFYYSGKSFLFTKTFPFSALINNSDNIYLKDLSHLLRFYQK